MKIKCKRCGYSWQSRLAKPKQCPQCKTYLQKTARPRSRDITDDEILKVISKIPKNKADIHYITAAFSISENAMREKLNRLHARALVQKVQTYGSNKILYHLTNKAKGTSDSELRKQAAEEAKELMDSF